jgi:hypothetical protein
VGRSDETCAPRPRPQWSTGRRQGPLEATRLAIKRWPLARAVRPTALARAQAEDRAPSLDREPTANLRRSNKAELAKRDDGSVEDGKNGEPDTLEGAQQSIDPLQRATRDDHRAGWSRLAELRARSEGAMSSAQLLFDAAGRRRSPAAMPGHNAGHAPKNKGMVYPADPPTVDEIVDVMRQTPGDRSARGAAPLRARCWCSAQMMHVSAGLEL